MHPSNTLKTNELNGWMKDDTQPAKDIESTLKERGAQYGKFADGARIMQNFKEVLRNSPNWETMKPIQKEALEMIVHKMGRILNGNPNNFDHWWDLVGYATLVVRELQGEEI